MRRRRVLAVTSSLALAGASLLAAAGVESAHAASSDPARVAGGWFYTTPPTMMFDHADRFADASPFWFSATGADTVGPNTYGSKIGTTGRATVVSQLHGDGLRVVPAVTDGMASRGMAQVLANPATRTQHVNALVNLVVNEGVDGIDLDYEQFAFNDGSSTWSTTKPAWTAFVGQLAAALHAKGKVLYATIPYVTGASGGYWVYDPVGIGPWVDRLRVMAYDYSTSAPGPIAPQRWVDGITTYLASVVTPSKVIIGVPNYGRDWFVPNIGQTCPTDSAAKTAMAVRARTTSGMESFLRTNGIPAARDAATNEMTYTYPVTISGTRSVGGKQVAASCTGRRVGWFADTTSALGKAQLMVSKKLGGLAFWTISGADPSLWNALPALSSEVGTPAVGVVATGAPLVDGVALSASLTNIAAGARARVLNGSSPVSLYGASGWTLAAGQKTVSFTVRPVSPGYAPQLRVEVSQGGKTTVSNLVSVVALGQPPQVQPQVKPQVSLTGTAIAHGVRLAAALTDVPAGSTIQVFDGGRAISLFGNDRWTVGNGQPTLTFTVTPVSAGYAPRLSVAVTTPSGEVVTSTTVAVAAG